MRPSQLRALGVSTSWIPILTFVGELKYEPPDVIVPRWPRYPLAARASVKWPRAVIAGPSALHLYELCAEPERLWLAVRSCAERRHFGRIIQRALEALGLPTAAP